MKLNMVRNKLQAFGGFDGLTVDGNPSLSISKVEIMNGDQSGQVTNAIRVKPLPIGFIVHPMITEKLNPMKFELASTSVGVRLFLDADSEDDDCVLEIFYHKGSLVARVVTSDHNKKEETY